MDAIYVVVFKTFFYLVLEKDVRFFRLKTSFRRQRKWNESRSFWEISLLMTPWFTEDFKLR